MAERYWEHKKPRRHFYVDGATGRVMGLLYQRLSDHLLAAHVCVPREVSIGDYATLDEAQAAVAAHVVVEEVAQAAAVAAAAAKVTAQADGETS